MLDLETLGNAPGCVIVAVGAVQFGCGVIKDEFYRRVDAESCVNYGLKLDVATVLWWMKQSDKARAELNKPGESLPKVLIDFFEWLDNPDVELWGNGADFDNQILAAAYRACELNLPWKFWNNRCYRTIKANYAHIPPDKKNGHNALEDARNQAEHLMKLVPSL
jgi:exodeoxyribonuclease VIII